MTSETEALAKTLGNFAGTALAIFAIYCLRAYLLSVCCAMFFPLITLGFWQWFLVALAVRTLIAPSGITTENDK